MTSIRPTETPSSPALATGALLGTADVDRVAALVHALLEEITDLKTRLAAVEARLDGRPAPEGLAAVQAEAGALIGRVTG